MADFAKAFVSHSSDDKSLVEKVVERVSAARWEIDSQTFEEGQSSASEIHAAITRSDLFVLFASRNSMSSPWVKSEIELAQGLLYSRKLRGVLVFITDDTEADELPDWLRDYVYVRTRNPVRMANLIRARLLQIDAQKGVEERPFVQRTKIRGEIERRLADLERPVQAIYLSGVDGIGRHAIARHTLRNLFPGMDVTGVEISLAEGEGLLEAYRKLHLTWYQPTLEETAAFFEEANRLPSDGLVERASKLLAEIGEAKSFVWLQFDYHILDDDGNFQEEFRSLFKSLRNKRPSIVTRK